MNQGKRMVVARRITVALVFVAVVASLAFDLGWGTPSSFGIGQFFLLCPLGGIEAMIASHALIPSAVLSLCVLLVFSLVFGRAWCSWFCPAPSIRRFFRREPKGKPAARCEDASKASGCATCAAQVAQGAQGVKPQVKRMLAACARDPRLWVLVGVLAVAFIIGFPIFCLVCPIGLTFGTVSSLWYLFVEKQVTLSCVVFPLCLAVELVAYRKWCVNVCPIGGLLSLFGMVAKRFRPHVDASKCYLYQGKDCGVCAVVCPELLNLHVPDAAVQLKDCSRCGECAAHCPADAIRIDARVSQPVEFSEE